MKKIYEFLFCGLLLLSLSSCFLGDQPYDYKTNPSGGHVDIEDVLAFISNRPDWSLAQVYTMHLDGSAQQLLPTSENGTSSVASSNHGERIVYTQDNPDTFISSLYFINRDGSGKRTLVDQYYCWDCNISLDGSRVVYIGEETSDTGGVYGMNADGSGFHHIVDAAGNRDNMFQAPALNADGSKVAFYYYYYIHPESNDRSQTKARQSSGNGIYQCNWDGTEEEPLVIDAEYESNCYPGYSPDGTKLVYVNLPWWGDFSIRILDLTNPSDPPVTIFTSSYYMTGMRYSYDGSRIWFSMGDTYGYVHIYSIDAATGGDLQQLTEGEYYDYFLN